MSETMKRFLGAVSLTTPAPISMGELVVVPERPTLDELAAKIRKAHADVEAALLTVAERALDAGLELKTAKAQIRHGGFEDYVAACGISMRSAQNYMRIAKYKIEVRQLIADKAQGNAHLSVASLLKFVTMLDARRKPKRKS